MSLKFGEPKTLNNMENVKKIGVKTNDEKPLRIVTKKCLSYGVKKSEKYNSKTVSIVLDEDSVKELRNVIENCEDHLKTSLSKILYEREDGSVTIYPKIRDFEEYKSVFYDEKGVEIDPMELEGKRCEIKCVLEIEGIILSEDKSSLQVRIYEAMVRKKVYEHKKILDMKW